MPTDDHAAASMLPLTVWQLEAIENWTLIEAEQARPRFAHVTRAGTVCLTVRAGWG
jgi:hypothetical protein